MGRFFYDSASVETTDFASPPPPSPPPDTPRPKVTFEFVRSTPAGANGKCLVYYVYWKIRGTDFGGPGYNMSFTCYSTNGPESCECSPECNGLYIGGTGMFDESELCPGEVMTDPRHPEWGVFRRCDDIPAC